jgi:hypothetical protein
MKNRNPFENNRKSHPNTASPPVNIYIHPSAKLASPCFFCKFT